MECYKNKLSTEDINRVIEMAWEDRTTFDAILMQFGLTEQEVIRLMQRELKPSSWRLWRKRVQGRKTKHAALRNFREGRHKCDRQRIISNNKVSKRR
ncbi:MAG: TIGR03643 family protein [Crocinitomicaceae bacterium]|nr:TIGR03643 family protein [Crocinitomicaceae bacterium]